MKVTLVIETINDKPIPEGTDMKKLEETCKMAWQIALNYICCISEDEESAKVIEAKVEEN